MGIGKKIASVVVVFSQFPEGVPAYESWHVRAQFDEKEAALSTSVCTVVGSEYDIALGAAQLLSAKYEAPIRLYSEEESTTYWQGLRS